MTDRQCIDRLFADVLEMPPAARQSFLDEVCANNPSLRAEIEALVAAAEQQDEFLAPGGALRGHFGRALGLNPESNTPSHAGPFRIVREIGRGGMSVVYLGEREKGGFEQRVAIKVMRPGASSDEVLQRFEQERQILASLNHPAIAKLLDGGRTDDGTPYFAMELVEGLPILEYCGDHDLSIERRLKLFVEAADAVTYAHSQQVIHRDLKPSNVMVNEAGQLRLLDFGIAKLLGAADDGNPALTQLPHSPMTLRYASPEQFDGAEVTTASDIYQLGVLMYELLTDQSPYHVSDNRMQTWAEAIAEQTPPRPSQVAGRPKALRSATTNTRSWRRSLRGDLDTIVMVALRKEPDRRYRSAAAMRDDVNRFLADQPISARRDSIGYRARKYLQHHFSALVAVAFAAIAIALLIFARPWAVSDAGEAAIAVLPFDEYGGGQSPDLGSSFANQLWSGLASAHELRVVARESSFPLASARQDISGIAATLDVSTVVTGFVRRGEQGIEVSVELFDGESGNTFWSRTYRYEFRSMLSLQREMLGDILKVLAARHRVSLVDTGGAASGTQHSEAYLLYLEAQHHAEMMGDGIGKAIALYEEALVLDPDFAHAWAGLATAYNYSKTFGPRFDDVEDRIETSARRAIELDPALGRAYIVLGATVGRRQSRIKALELAQKAVSLSPNDPEVLHAITQLMFVSGWIDDAQQFAERLYEISPLGPTSYWMGIGHLLQGGFDEAAGFCDLTWSRAEVQPPMRCSLLARIERGDVTIADEWLDLHGRFGDTGWDQALQTYLDARQQPSPTTRRRALEKIGSVVDEGAMQASFAAYLYVTLGELDRAFDVLNKQLDRGGWIDAKFWWLPSQSALRRDSRFGPLAEREGMATVWRAMGWPDACRPVNEEIVCK